MPKYFDMRYLIVLLTWISYSVIEKMDSSLYLCIDNVVIYYPSKLKPSICQLVKTMCPSLGRWISSNITYKDKTWVRISDLSHSAFIASLIS